MLHPGGPLVRRALRLCATQETRAPAGGPTVETAVAAATSTTVAAISTAATAAEVPAVEWPA